MTTSTYQNSRQPLLGNWTHKTGWMTASIISVATENITLSFQTGKLYSS